MDPAVLNYLQQQQQSGQPQANNQPQAPMQGQGGPNPFDVGISRAIESARQSLGMTQKQQDKALKSSMLAFAQNMSQQPKERGFWNNFSSVGKALAPAISTYDQEEGAALGENNNLANQILQHQGNERDRQAAEEERLWRRKFAEDQLGETRRNHNLMDSFRRNKEDQKLTTISSNNSHTKSNKSHKGNTESLDKIFNYAEKVIEDYGNKGYRNRAERIANNLLPGGYNKDPEQSAIDTMGDVIKGQLFNTWNYRNRAEFEHVPTISSSNPPNVNKENLKHLKNLLLNVDTFNDQIPIDNDNGLLELPSISQTVLMSDPSGSQYQIPPEEVEGAIADGLMIVE